MGHLAPEGVLTARTSCIVGVNRSEKEGLAAQHRHGKGLAWSESSTFWPCSASGHAKLCAYAVHIQILF